MHEITDEELDQIHETIVWAHYEANANASRRHLALASQDCVMCGPTIELLKKVRKRGQSISASINRR